MVSHKMHQNFQQNILLYEQNQYGKRLLVLPWVWPIGLNLSSIFFDPPYNTCVSNTFSPSHNDSNPLHFSSVSSYGTPIAHSSPCTTQPEPPLREKIKVWNKNNNLRAIIINFQSLKNKKPDLQLTIDKTNPDIIFGCEAWLNKKI